MHDVQIYGRRIEIAVSDISFFRHDRKFEHDGRVHGRDLALLIETINRPIDLREIRLGDNQRYRCLCCHRAIDPPEPARSQNHRCPCMWTS
jgi:hypothetical protein